MRMSKGQLGNIQIILIIFLLVGIIVGVILVQRQTNILSKAKEWGCQQPPACLSYDPPCQVSKPFRGWCSRRDEPTVGCIPRPPCLDAKPSCLIPEPAEGWCAKTSPKPTSETRPTTSPQASTSSSFVPNPLPEPKSCDQCKEGYDFCYNKTTKQNVCIKHGEVKETSTNLNCKTCPVRILPISSASPDTGL